ncbi:MFS transporter [Qipengyuania sp. ASV99]|uniref:MFS transporter n=1 Tax=Qipengyuania sp. ASV99 TaxID=3399681 RepID=UPI003A4C55AE
MSERAGERQPIWFLILFALAAGGGSVAYVPLLTVLLPLKITVLTGAEDVPALAQVTFFGAVVASLANIAFGILSDLTGRRPLWIAAGLVTSSVLLIAIGQATRLSEVIVLVMAWQLGLNMMLSPLLAWAGDCFPDSQKGVLGGALAFAPAMGALSGSLVTFESVVDPQHRLALVAGLVSAMVLPVLIAGRGRARPDLMRGPDHSATEFSNPETRQAQRALAGMWMARFLVQIAEAGLFAFLLFWLRSLSDGFHENTAANIFSAVLVLSVPLALMVGRWSDRRRRPMLPLSLCAGLAAAGLMVMAAASGLELAIAGYVLFGISASIFLSLHTGQTLRVLPKPERRGRDMGLFNLTNTVPSLVMPWLTLTLVPGFGFTGLFALFAGLSVLAAIVLAGISVRR